MRLPRAATLLLCLAAAAPAGAQPGVSPAELHLSFNERGAAVLRLEVPLTVQDTASLEAALAQSLGAPLRRVDVKRFGTAFVLLEASTEPALPRAPTGFGRAGDVDVAPLLAALRPLGAGQLDVFVCSHHVGALTVLLDPTMAFPRLSLKMLALALLAAVLLGNAWLNLKNARLVPLPDGPARPRLRVRRGRHATAAPGLPVTCRPVAPRQRLRPHGPLAVHLTPPVLEHFSTREVDALLAHELTFLARRPGRLSWRSIVWGLFLWVLLTALLLLSLFGAIAPDRWWPVMFVALVGRGFLSPLAARRYASEFDVPSLPMTGDAEALLIALAKLADLGLLPLTGHEGPPAHARRPWRRLEDIAEQSNIPPDGLEEILTRPSAGGDTYGAPPADVVARLAVVAPDAAMGPVLTSAARQRLLVPLVWGQLVATAAAPAVGLAPYFLAWRPSRPVE